jgi:hypothetical protein
MAKAWMKSRTLRRRSEGREIRGHGPRQDMQESISVLDRDLVGLLSVERAKDGTITSRESLTCTIEAAKMTVTALRNVAKAQVRNIKATGTIVDFI